MSQPSKEVTKRYDQTPKGKFRRYKSCAKQRGIEFKLTFEEFCSFWKRECFYCGYKIFTIGLDRCDNTKGYEMGNIVACCARDNGLKSNLTQAAFFQSIREIAQRHSLL